MKIAVLGRTQTLFNTITALELGGHEITFVATCKAAPEYKIKEDGFAAYAEKKGIPFLLTNNLNCIDSITQLSKTNSDVAISINWINRLGSQLCELFPYGVLNAHAGDLPKYKGNAPIAWAILQGESSIGITIHQMDPYEIDSGPILLKKKIIVDELTYIGSIYKQLDELVPSLFVEVIQGIEQGACSPRSQSMEEIESLRCYSRKPEDGRIHWRHGSEYLGRLVRASAEPFSGAFAFWEEQKIVIWRARAESWHEPSLAVPGQVISINRKCGEVAIATGDGLLILEEVEAHATGRIPPATILKSMRSRLN